MPKSQDIVKLVRHHYSGIKTELETVYITSSGDKYFKEMDAICAEAQIQQAKESQQRRREKIMGIIDLILKVMEEENWGLYYKNEPMHSLNTNDGGMLYKVNDVDLDEIERVLLNKLESTIEKKENDCKEHTAHHLQQENNLSQSEN